MSQQSITNKLIANIKQVQATNVSSNFVNSNNVICIDSSNNRIGINTKDPAYSIDICGSDVEHAINSHDLRIRNEAHIEEASCNKIRTNDLSINNIVDISFANFNTLSGETIDVSFIRANDISIDEITIPTIYFNTIDGITAHITNLTILPGGNLELSGNAGFSRVEDTFETITVTGDISSVYLLKYNEMSGQNIKAYEISCNNLNVIDEAKFLNKADFSYISVANEASFNDITVANEASFNKISVIGEASFNTINATNITIDGTDMPSLTNFTGLQAIGATKGTFTNLTVDNLLDVNGTSDSTIDNLTIKNRLNFDLSNGGKLILPSFSTVENDPFSNSIAYDATNNIIHICNENNLWKSFDVAKKFLTVKLNAEISGNDILTNTLTNTLTYEIDNSDNLLLQNEPLYKKIPLSVVNTSNTFNISTDNSSCSILFDNLTTIDDFEINANISLRFLNKVPGDVEANNYTFGIYPDISATNTDNDSVENPYVEIKNSILVFDNSYNYANSSISYIGNLDNNTYSGLDLIRGLSFYIKSDKDINYLAIHSFNCTIKKL